jgi:GTP-binding protein EngB required for normal cell division
VNSLQKPNVLVAGLTGSGKSSIINLVFNNDIAVVGPGQTKKFSKYDSDDMKVVIYDSEGIDDDDPSKFIESCNHFFAERKSDTFQAIHIIWYLIDSTRGMVEPGELALFNGIFADIPLIFLLNKADKSSEEQRNKIKNTLTDLALPNCNGIFNVVSVKSKAHSVADIECCPQCKCDDIIIYKKTSIMSCRGCNFQINLARVDNPVNELSKVVEATHDILPVGIRQAFVYSQNVSFHLKSESAKHAIVEFWTNFSTTKTRAKLLKGVTQMLADLCFLWDFKTYGQAYAEAMANRALASFSWQDTVNLWLSKKFHAQCLKATALGILWHHCLKP